jgi:ADP-ribose pyrophosphatase YjhB (NUDIX family)
MLRLIPPAVHRAALRVAHRLRHNFRRVAKLPLAGVSLIAVDDAGRVLLVRHSYGPKLWMLPGGGLKRGEDAATAAAREMREELGCALENVELIATLEETISGAPHTAHVFAATIREPLRPDRREVIDARFFAVDDLPRDLSNLSRHRIEAWLEQR